MSHPSPCRPALRRLATGLSAAVVLAAPLLITVSASAAGPRTLIVATTGNDNAPGTSARPLRTVQRGVNLAQPGDQILIRPGRYHGVVKITHSGTAAAPITIGPESPDGGVTLTSTPRPRSCDAHTPAPDRTIDFEGGADYWTIQGLRIEHGVIARGTHATEAIRWLAGRVNRGEWELRRSIPGRGVNDPVAARGALAAVSQRIGARINPSDGLRLINNEVVGRGLQLVASRYGEVIGNSIHDIDCGTGPGIWINVYSDGWLVANNTIRNIAPATFDHYMYEGIRLGSASSYNIVSNNLVENIEMDGRAFTTDVDPSWNRITHNVARNVNQGFNDQMSGWGNTWAYNVAENSRLYGFNFRAIDDVFPRPSLNSSTYKATVTCNISRGAPTNPELGADLHAGGLKSSTFDRNTFPLATFGPYVRGYWADEGNIWNGRSRPPGLHPRQPAPGACD